MKVILVLQITKIGGLTGQLLFCTTRVLQVNRTVRTSFIVIPYTPSVFLFNFVNNNILGYCLGPQLYQNDPGLKRFVLLRPTWVQLLIQETFIFKGTLQSITLDENQLLTIKFNHSFEVWSESPPKKAK